MKNTITILLFFILNFFSLGKAYADEKDRISTGIHDKPAAEAMFEKKIDRLSEKLKLTPEQRGKITVILKNGWDKIDAEKKRMREMVLNIRRESDNEIEKILTPEQQSKFKKFQKRMANKGNKRHEK